MQIETDSSRDMQAAPSLNLLRLHPNALDVVAAGYRRDWMDETSRRFAYRCTPMVIANSTGWEILCPSDFTVTWGGGIEPDKIRISYKRGDKPCYPLVCSHFGHGILTFHPGYVFQTSPDWALWARGVPNYQKDGIYPLEGIIETDWLPFSFTMNWRFTAPGEVTFRRGEPLAFITLVPHRLIDEIRPTILNIQDNPVAYSRHNDWLISRRDFNDALADPNSAESREGWQRRYLNAYGAPPGIHHVKKRRLHDPS